MKRLRHGEYVGGKESAEHSIWRTMMARCNVPSAKNYPSYGGRGIRVCKRWRRFEHFLEDMGRRPSSGHSIERVHNERGYTPSNCVWATRSQQQKNKTSTRVYANDRFKGTLVEVARYLGISKELAHWRFKAWGTFEKGVAWHELQKRQ